MSNPRLIAFIPARGGSKGIPGKNMVLLASKPLIDYTIRAAHDAGIFARVIVSTDDETIAEYSRNQSCEVHHRPPELATDVSRVVDAVLAGADLMQLEDVDVVFVLQPTSPLRRAAHIREAASLQLESGTGGVVSVVECEHHPMKTVMLEHGKLRPVFDASLLETSRQKLPQLFRPNGAIYGAPLMRTRELHTLVCSGDAVMRMSNEDSIDIDSLIDLNLAEHLLQRRK